MDCAPQIHIAAIHSQAGYSNETRGLAILCREADYFLSGGGFNNSNKRWSNYATVGYQPLTFSGVRVGAFAGMATGYRTYQIPMAGLAFSWKGLNFAAIPAYQNVTPAVIEMSYAFDFK